MDSSFQTLRTVALGVLFVVVVAFTVWVIDYESNPPLPDRGSRSNQPFESAPDCDRAEMPAVPEKGARATFIGDALSAGDGLAKSRTGYAQQTVRKLGWTFKGFTDDQAGYLNPGLLDLGVYADRIDDVVRSKPDVVVVQGSLNDLGRPGLDEAATDLYSTLVSELPDAAVVVLGPVPNKLHPDLEGLNAELREAAECVGVDFVDAIDEGWAVPRSTSDKSLPSQDGHDEMADRFVADLRELQ